MKSILFILLCSTSLFAGEKTLNIAIVQEWGNFNPVTSQLASNEALFPFIIRKMVSRTVDGKVLPDVAESVPQLKNKVANWTIKKTAKWGDGTLITCADWKLGWEAGLSPQVSVDSRGSYSKIKNIEWTENKPQTCKVTYTTNEWTFERDLPPLIPSHLEKTVFDKFKSEPEGYDRNTNYISHVTNPGLYNGPYIISEFKLGSHLILIKNPHYFENKSNVDKIIIKHISDTSALKANLLSNQIDIVSAVGFPPDTALSLDEEFVKTKSRFKVRFQNSSIFQGIFLNHQSEILKDVKIRQALYKAIDKSVITKSFFNNKLEPAEGILPPQHAQFKKLNSQYSKQEARQILEQSGWKLNKEGIREKNGKTLSLIYKTSAGIKVLENIQVYICAQFKEIGVQCVVKNEPPRTFLGVSVPHGEFDLAMYGQPVPPDSSLTSYFSSTEIPNDKNSWAGGNSMRIQSKELDQLLKKFDSEANMSKRNQLIGKMQDHLIKDYAFIPLYHRKEAIVVPQKLSGLTEVYDGTSFSSPEQWKLAD